MPADKKISSKDLPRPEGEDEQNKGQEEYDEKPKDQSVPTGSKDEDEKGDVKKKGSGYVKKDLPMY